LPWMEFCVFPSYFCCGAFWKIWDSFEWFETCPSLALYLVLLHVFWMLQNTSQYVGILLGCTGALFYGGITAL
jgi:hypothetical protein